MIQVWNNFIQEELEYFHTSIDNRLIMDDAILESLEHRIGELLDVLYVIDIR